MQNSIIALDADTRIAVTGATGFVGQAVVKQLLDVGYRQVVAIARNAPTEPLASDGVLFQAADMSNSADACRALADCQIVINLVGIIRPTPRQSYHRSHVTVIENVVYAMRQHGIKRLIHMSALGARAGAVSIYHRTKWLAERIIAKSQLDTTIIRPGLIVGDGGEFTQMLDGWSRGWAAPFLFMPYFGRGLTGQVSARIAPVRVEDVAKLFQWCVDRPVSIGKIYQLSGPRIFTWPEFLRIYALTRYGRHRAAIGIPGWLGRLLGQLPGLPFTSDQVAMAVEDNTSGGNEIQSDMPDFFAGDVF